MSLIVLVVVYPHKQHVSCIFSHLGLVLPILYLPDCRLCILVIFEFYN